MKDTDHTAAITILDRTYHIKCLPEEVPQLQASANYLNSEMRKMGQSSQLLNPEKLAVVAALNIAHELMTYKNQKNAYIDVMHEQIKSLQRRIQQFLGTKEEVVA